MKKEKTVIILGVIVYLLIIIISSIFIIKPGITTLQKAIQLKELTFEEKTALIDDINQKYIMLEQDVNKKYVPLIENVNNKYAPSIEAINKKYVDLEEQIKEDYNKKEKELNDKINKKDQEENREFLKNGFSNKFYTLRDELSALYAQKTELSSKEFEELRKNSELKHNELKNINNNKTADLKTLDENKLSELNRLKDNKINEIDKINNQNSNKDELKSKGIKKIILGIIVILIPALYIIYVFNKLTKLLNKVKKSWSSIDILLKQRTDLIPNIVETVKGYSNHEKGTFINVTKARNQVVKATTKEEEIKANKNLSNAINRLFFLQEDYPELKADANFLSLQDNLREIENQISYARHTYNNNVLHYKNKLEMFPSNIIANIFGFEPEIFFETDEDDKKNPNVNFN